MEPAGQNGTRTDHDRDPAVNGVNGTSVGGGQGGAPDKGKAPAASNDNGTVNGGEVGGTALDRSPQMPLHTAGPSTEAHSRMNDLPDEIRHITEGFIPLSLLLTRLAQVTHNSLQEKIAELAKMPVPTAATNGGPSYTSGGPDDSSSDNLRKKGGLTSFAQDMHGKWLKALVITEWSRKSEMVSKLIDLKFHIDQQRILYDASLDDIVNVKRDLAFARMPSPDLKTALQVLSTGTGPWMPDLKWMNDLNTLLSLRLNLDDYDKIPYHFRNYEIGSGRVTFKVDGEFEVDLTIADEDFEKQFWFIDFRYAFTPAAASLSDSLRTYLEGCVNEALSKDGLAGCYQFLHEFVLTCKINELKRQALQLSRSSWTGTLVVEPLNRALAIQYWTSRTTATGTKSWILLAVNSGRKPNGETDPKSSSFLVAKWYRDNKEMKNVSIELDVRNLSTEALLTDVVDRHIAIILTSIHDKLLTAARFKNRETGMILDVAKSNPAASHLTMRAGWRSQATLLVEPMTGVFALKPHSRFTIQYEHQLNGGKNAAEDGVACLENVRCALLEDEISRRGSCMGWLARKSPLTLEEMRSVTKLREWTRAIWLQKVGWGANWFVVVFMGLGGDEWWLLEANGDETNRALKYKAQLPLNKGYPDQAEAFWNNLALFATGIITQSVDMRELHRHKIRSKSNDSMDVSLPLQVRIPSTELSLSTLFPAMVSRSEDGAEGGSSEGDLTAENVELFSLMQKHTGTALTPKRVWADNVVTINFKGLQSLSKSADETRGGGTAANVLMCVSDAIIKVQRPATFEALQNTVDRDVSYDPRKGEFSVRIRRRVGKPILDALKSRIKAIDRFVNFFEALENANGTITGESVALKQVAFSYGEMPTQNEGSGQCETQAPKRWRAVLDLSKDDIGIEVEAGNPHLRVVDLMRRLVNGDGGIGALMAWLPASLPALKAVDEMESRWASLQAEKRGRFEFSMKSIAWMSIGYDFTASQGRRQIRKHVALEVRMRPRRGEAWWHVLRSHAGANAAAEDEFDKALKPIWAARGEDWLGLATGAAGRPSSGVVGMMLAVDDAIRSAVLAGASSSLQKRKQSQSQPAARDIVVLD
ncbi:Mediator of RNA polymerase II transcription subunit 14 [Tolypocladium capitatum]|uniref:Mediator of RNA polymerase II transcription subunit 14 n=1 Tax=Tolypocladium capitatum TaxID=45235 RepID=A0A2K3QHX5_9HYPO|nr:Mediator of RNA polymerase II transcription subunit 14 [Tolypocladium capitatum]